VSAPARVTAEQLNAVMEFEHVIRVLEDGRVESAEGIYAPELIDSELEHSSAWSLLNGWSGQDRYAGPIMHPSEYIGGRLATWILENPGIYVALVDYSSEDEEPAGWAIATLEETALNCAREALEDAKGRAAEIARTVEQNAS